MLKDNVVLRASYEGKREDLSTGIDYALDDALQHQIGLRREDVSFAPQRLYEVKVNETYQGKSNVSLDEAINEAVKNASEGVKETTMKVSVEQTVEAPYCTVPIVARSLDMKNLPAYHDIAVRQLQDTYGKRLNPKIDSVQYRVLHTDKKYQNDSHIPKEGVDQNSVVKEGVSSTSFDDALRKATLEGKREIKRAKRTVYEQTSQMIVYGTESTETLGAPYVATGRKSEVRAASPAGLEPVALSNTHAFM